MSKIVRDKRPVLESWGGDRWHWNAFPLVALPADDALAPYLGVEHNDAEVLGCVRERTRFFVTINHYNVWRLASVVKDDWHELRRSFPVSLCFQGVKELIVIQQREIGNYRVLRSSLDDLPSILCDVIALRCIGVSEEGFRFVLTFNGRRSIRTQKEVDNGISVLLECSSVTVGENLRQNWIESVGAESLALLNALLREGPVQGWNVPDFERFVADQGSGRR